MSLRGRHTKRGAVRTRERRPAGERLTVESLDRTLRRASKDRLVALVEDLCGVVPASRLLDVLGRHVDLDALTAPPETASDEPRSVLRDVGKFHAASLAGDYYDPFPVNSRNFMVRSEGAVDWEQECERLLQRCRTASRHGHHAQARECFDLLFDLLCVLLRQAIARRLGDVAEPWSGTARRDRRGVHS